MDNLSREPFNEIREAQAERMLRTGATYHVNGNFEAARFHYLAALRAVPDEPSTLISLCGVLYALGYHRAAVSVGRKAVKFAPDVSEARENLAISLMAIHDPSAFEHMQQSLKMNPGRATTWYNWGNMLYRKNDFVGATKAFEKALELGHWSIDLRCDYGLAMMGTGQFCDGIGWYECRWQTFYREAIRDLNVPTWSQPTENLSEKHVLLVHEQGFGDSIMLARFITSVVERGATVSLATRTELIRLFKENFPNVANIIDWEDLPAAEALGVDFKCHMLDLPRLLEQEPKDISPLPYLKATPAKSGIDDLQPGFRVGLCWTSGDHGPKLALRRRRIPLTDFLPLIEIPGIQVFSLQKGTEGDEISDIGANDLIYDFISRCEDFYETAQLISKLDLVVSVDSAVAHLAGALGKPVLMLSPYTRCWRWWNLPTGLPWYQNFEVFSQDENGLWDSTIKAALARIAEMNSRRVD